MNTLSDCETDADPTPQTYHAPPERCDIDDLLPTHFGLSANSVVQSLLEGYPEIALVLNQQRQIVVCNQALLLLLGAAGPAQVLGKRLGEVLGCVHADEMQAGCGTSESCRTCGAVNAMLLCQKQRDTARAECRLTTSGDDGPAAHEFEVVATPLDFEDQTLMVFAARDISAAKRREALERLFFHDTLNVAGAIRGLAELLGSGADADRQRCPQRLDAMSRQLIEQIRGQRDLAAAERGELQPIWTPILVSDLFDDLRDTYESHPVAHDRALVFEPPHAHELDLDSDAVLLQRVLGNLIKNALEASEAGERVTVGCRLTEAGEIRFGVHNPSVMPRRVQLQIFQRSFSTKGGAGRGLGTFSVKLLATRYLNGGVDFTSDQHTGTTFFVTLPRRQTNAAVPQPTAVGRDRSRANAAADSSRSGEIRLDGVRLLLAEDGPDNQRFIKHVLQQVGARVTVVENGQLACDAALSARAAKNPFRIILMDMQMPVMDGYQAAAYLRGESYSGPIIALTAHTHASDREKCRSAGCDDYVEKPLDRGTLIETIRQHAKQ